MLSYAALLQSTQNSLSQLDNLPTADEIPYDIDNIIHNDEYDILNENIFHTEYNEYNVIDLYTDSDNDDVHDSNTLRHQQPGQHSNSQLYNVYTWQWLMKQIESYIKLSNTELDIGYLVQSTLQLLNNATYNDNQLSDELYNIYGDNGLEFITILMINRHTIKTIKPQSTVVTLQSNNNLSSSNHLRNLIGVSVQHSNDISIAKQQRKLDKKMNKLSIQQYHTNDTIDENKLDEQANMLSYMINTNTADELYSQLPSNSQRTIYKQYEHVVIPPIQPPDIDTAKLIPISTLPDWAQLSFPNTKYLNRIQSRVFDSAFHHNNNLLICAPTGAGKTNIAMLCVLHEISQHIESGILNKSFKIVYVAPMKALAQQIQSTFQLRLKLLGITVKEVTGDTQLSKSDIESTQMLITTPEKWDVMTRKSCDSSLIDLVKLLIIDEIHLLHDERGPVLEILVARTLRRVEATQQMCRIVGLSATLPNYMDVALFLGVHNNNGLYYFDSTYRPVPLEQQYIGVIENNMQKRVQLYNELTYKKTLHSLRAGHQVMIFVHSRRDTVMTARAVKDIAAADSTSSEFSCQENTSYHNASKQLQHNSNNSELRELFQYGFGIHHAGMIRSDRAFVEQQFLAGLISVLVCTATLAWGVNLPAHTVIIKGTQIYDSKRGGYVDVGMLDVMQIFGRAGRPGYDTSGEGILITEQSKLIQYLRLLTHSLPIESQLLKSLPDHLNAEIVLGTVSTINEAVTWLSYTYLYTRMLKNPMIYGITYDELQSDRTLLLHRRQLILVAIKQLIQCRMIRFDSVNEILYSTDIGRVASHYYIQCLSMEQYNMKLMLNMSDSEIIHLIASSTEFEQIKLRDDECNELDELVQQYCPIKINDLHSTTGKVNLLLQSHISRALMSGSTLISDQYYVTQSTGRITRALYELVLKRGKAYLAERLLTYTKMIDRRIWDFQSPMRQFDIIKSSVINQLEQQNISLTDILNVNDIEKFGRQLHHNTTIADTLIKHARQIPYCTMQCAVQPITSTVLKLSITLTCKFNWSMKYSGSVESFYIWVCDMNETVIHYNTLITLHNESYHEPHTIQCTIPVFNPMPESYVIKCISDRWLGSESNLTVDVTHIVLPHNQSVHTKLLDLHPIPVTSLYNTRYQQLYTQFQYFNPIQTQLFHTCYHTDHNILLGAPTGSGKTIIAELCMLRQFTQSTQKKIIYIAPLKALTRERVREWNHSNSIAGILNKSIIELTGDTQHDHTTIQHSDIIITTPEKFDGITRNWNTRRWIQSIGLIVIVYIIVDILYYIMM